MGGHWVYGELFVLPDAPNPGMRVDGPVGTVLGLPLDSVSAERPKTCCTLAPFGKGTRTVVDRTVRDTWEVDASQVRFTCSLLATLS